MMINGHARVAQLVTQRELVLKLFANDIEPTPGDQASRYREPSSYAAKTLSPTHWRPTPTGLSYPEVVFTFGESIGDVYGAILVLKATGELLGVQRFGDRPITIATPYHKLLVTVHLQ